MTATAATNAKPKERGYKLRDGGGMYLWVAPTAAKSWRYDYRLFGVDRTFTLGTFPVTSLSEARALHQKARIVVHSGSHPLDLKKEEAACKARELGNTFEALAAGWLETRKSELAPTTHTQTGRELKKHVLPKIGTRPIGRISRADIAELVKRIESKTPETARNCRSHISAVFEYAVNSGAIAVDPTPPRKILGVRRPKSHAAAPAADLGKILVAISSGKHNRETEIAFRLLTLTLLRKSEVVEAEWSEINLDKGIWLVPKDRKKERRDFLVCLPKQATSLLCELRTLSKGRLLFPNRDDPNRPMANRTLNALLERHKLSGLTKVHGLRASASTHLNDSDPLNSDVIEYALAHAVGSSVKRIYDRGDREIQRAVLLQNWADYLENLEKAANASHLAAVSS